MPETVNLAIYQGDDYAANVTVKKADGTPADLTGYSAQAQIRPSLADQAATPAAQFITSINGNVISLVLGHEQTKALTRSAYFWDVQIISPNAWITTLLAGKVAITMEVTKVYDAGIYSYA